MTSNAEWRGFSHNPSGRGRFSAWLRYHSLK
jgi:hypothetical protein